MLLSGGIRPDTFEEPQSDKSSEPHNQSQKNKDALWAAFAEIRMACYKHDAQLMFESHQLLTALIYDVVLP